MTGRTCPHCDGVGVLRWQQAFPTASGFVLREMEHPCPLGCGPTWRYPVAEADLVIDQADDVPEQRAVDPLIERAD